MTLFIIWVLGAILFGAVLAYTSGRAQEDSIIGVGWALALAWPLVLIVAIITLPFVGLYILGEKHRKRDEEKSN